MTSGAGDDAVTAEIIRNALTVSAEEASVIVVRSSHSTWIQEGADAAAAILAADGRLVAQSAATSLMHAASLRCGLQSLLDDIPASSMLPGDVYALNDPYRGGIHANDIMVFRPVFAEGDAAYVAGTVIHVADVGGSNAGGLASLATDTFAEGLLLPPVRLYQAGERQDDVFALIARNSRLPDKTLGDVGALIAGTTTVARRLEALIDRYGGEILDHHVARYLDYCERRVRAELAHLPPGTFDGRFVIDTDGIDPDRDFVVEAAVEVGDGAIRIDFTGTSPQAQGPINASRSQALSGVVYAVRSLIDPTIPMNEGSFAPVDLVLPSGSLLNPEPPAACGGRIVCVTAAVDAILDALGGVLPDRAVAPSSLIQVFALAGTRSDDGRGWVHMSYEFGGIGARAGSDGPNATGCYFLGGRSVIPQIEPVEAAHPVLVDAVRLIPDSGGAGRQRGGLGVEMRIRLLDEADVTVRGDRIVMPPPGAAGGLAGGAGGFRIERVNGTVESLAPRQSHVPIGAGDVFVMRTSGGGGLGPPNERAWDLVAADLRDGLLSRDAAEEVYGQADLS
jgi:N-methylhydantoinase B